MDFFLEVPSSWKQLGEGSDHDLVEPWCPASRVDTRAPGILSSSVNTRHRGGHWCQATPWAETSGAQLAHPTATLSSPLSLTCPVPLSDAGMEKVPWRNGAAPHTEQTYSEHTLS